MKPSTLIKYSVLPIIILFLCNSCSKDDDDISLDLTGSWRVIYFMDGNAKITKTEDNTWPNINNGDITADFTGSDSNGKGTISGIRVTNEYGGDYTVKKDGTISIGPIFSTDINEPEWTRLFHINSAENYEVKNSKLFIYYANKKNVIVLERNLD